MHARGKYEELATFINESARQNGVNFKIEENLRLHNKIMSDVIDENGIKTHIFQTEYSIWNDLKQMKILRNFIVTVLTFAFMTYTYFLMGLYMKYAVGNIFFNTLVTSILDVIAYLSIYVILKFIGLKSSLTVLSSIAILSGIPLIFNLPVKISNVCLILTRFGIQATYP